MIVKAAKQRRTNILSSIEELRKHTEQFGCVFSDPTLARGPNRDLMVEVERVVAQCSTSMMAHVDAFCSEFDTANKTLKVLLATLFEKHREQELGFQAIIDRDNRAREQSHARASLERQKHDLLQKKQVCAEHRVELQEQELHRKRLLRQLRELEDQRFSVREAVAHRINAKLSPGVQVNVTQYANADQYQNRLEDALRNARIQRRVVARKLAGAICPTQLAHIVRERDTETLVARGNLNRVWSKN